MKPLYRGLAVALIHLLIVGSLGAKLLYDRATRPRVWVRTGQVDPDLPIRGRYFTLSVEVSRSSAPSEAPPRPSYGGENVELAVENGKLTARQSARRTGMYVMRRSARPDDDSFILSSALVFFIPEHAASPHLLRGDELWAEVTVPRNGPPRPIQLAIKRGDQWMPLNYR
jgi:hypothetical protein